MALYDRVTGLPNRRFFEYELRKAITRIKREGETAALMMIDVDDFKKVNDLCGHQMGDEVLSMIAARLKNVLRTDDILAVSAATNSPPSCSGGGTGKCQCSSRKDDRGYSGAISNPADPQPCRTDHRHDRDARR